MDAMRFSQRFKASDDLVRRARDAGTAASHIADGWLRDADGSPNLLLRHADFLQF